jgi:hypothetical protein
MFTIDSTIDQIQGSKKDFVKKWVTNTQVSEALNSYVDVQTQFVKQAVKSANAVGTVIADEMVRATKEMGKIDYAKFGEGFAKVYLDQQKLWASNPWAMPTAATEKTK